MYSCLRVLQKIESEFLYLVPYYAVVVVLVDVEVEVEVVVNTTAFQTLSPVCIATAGREVS